MRADVGYEDLIPLAELYERLLPKAPELEAMAHTAERQGRPLGGARLRGKAEGMRLACSFITEAMNERGLTRIAQAHGWIDLTSSAVGLPGLVIPDVD